MTVVIGKVNKKTNSVVLTGDSRVSKHTTIAHNICKIFRSGDFYLGIAGAVPVAQLLKNTVQFPTKELLEKENVTVDTRFVINHIVPTLKKIVANNGWLDQGKFADIQLILAYQDQLFIIDPSFTVIKTDQAVIGCGTNPANASLEFRRMGLDTKKEVMMAIKYATDRDSGCGMPAYLVDTKENIFYTYDAKLQLSEVEDIESLQNQW